MTAPMAAVANKLIGDWLDMYADDFPDRPALEFRGMVTKWGEMRARVDACARAFLAQGITRGDRIAFLCSPRPEAFISFLAAARIGALWVGLNPKYQFRELAYVVADAQPKLLIALQDFEGRGYAPEVQALATGQSAIGTTVLIQDDPEAPGSLYAWAAQAAGQNDAAALAQARQAVRETDPAMLVYTSGSSGNPKGVLLRQRELLQRSATQNASFPADPYPVVINPLPINHIGGMHFLSLFTFVGGGCIRFQERLSTAGIVQALHDRSINMLYVMPTIFKLIVDEPGFSPALLDNVQWFIFSGAAMSTELIDIIKSASCRVGLTYGMTETCGSVTYADLDANAEVLANTIGRPRPAGEVRVADEHGQPCAVDVPGELQVRAEFCMGGYLNRPEATDEAFTADGWLRTGDSAILRADGNLRFIGRRSEMFKSGGYNVYPREVELVLEAHPAILLSAVVGVPHPLYDEVGWAYIVPADPVTFCEDELREWCREQLANYKVPKRFLVESELPLLPIGKVDKVGLRQRAHADSAFTTAKPC